MQQTIFSNIRYSVRLKISAGVALVATADFLFYQHDLGWTAGAFAALILVALVIFNPLTLRSKYGFIAIVATGGQCLALVNDPGLLSFVLVSVGMVSVAIFGRGHNFDNAATWARRVGRFVPAMLVRLPADAGKFGRAAQRKNDAGAWTRHAREWTLPLILSFVFLCLFSGANPVISRIFNLVPWDDILVMLTLLYGAGKG